MACATLPASNDSFRSPYAAGLGAPADRGFVGLDDNPGDPVVITGRKATCGNPLTTAQKQVNQLIAAERARSSTPSPT